MYKRPLLPDSQEELEKLLAQKEAMLDDKSLCYNLASYAEIQEDIDLIKQALDQTNTCNS